MKTTIKQIGLLAGSAITAVSLVACGGGGGGSGGSTTPATTAGTLGVKLIDAPACGFDAVNVTVNKVRVNTSATASDTDAGWTDITLNPARKINLLKLTNGLFEDLGQTTLSAGHYSQMRLVLDPNTGNGMANSVVPTGGTETTLTTPSAVQSGIKLVNEFDVAAGQHVDLVLDFNACKSVVTQGNGKYLLKPVVKVVPTAVVGISGVVATSLLGSHVTVSAEQNGQVIGSTVPDDSGNFFLSHLATGNYDVVITADNHAAAVIGTVPVASTGSTVVSSTSAPIDLPASAMASIAGTVTLPANATEAAYVAAKQSFTAGPTVTIKYAGADLSTGAYTIANLPVAAPMYATYGGATVPLTFAATPTVVPGAGKYQVDASGTGYTTKSISLVDVSTANATGVNFTLTP